MKKNLRTSNFIKNLFSSIFITTFLLGLMVGVSFPAKVMAQTCKIDSIDIKDVRNSLQSVFDSFPYGMMPYGWNTQERKASVAFAIKGTDCEEEELLLKINNGHWNPQSQLPQTIDIKDEVRGTFSEYPFTFGETSEHLVVLNVGEMGCMDIIPTEIDNQPSGGDFSNHAFYDLARTYNSLLTSNATNTAFADLVKGVINTGLPNPVSPVFMTNYLATEPATSAGLVKLHNSIREDNSVHKYGLLYTSNLFFFGEPEGDTDASGLIERSGRLMTALSRGNYITQSHVPKKSECSVLPSIHDASGTFLKQGKRLGYACGNDGSKNNGDCATASKYEYPWEITDSISNGVPIDKNSPCYDKLTGQMDPDCYELLAPIAGLADETTIDANGRVRGTINLNGKAGGIGNYVNSMLTIVIGLMGIAAVVMIAYAGFEYMTVETFSKKDSAKGRIKNTLIALVLILSIWTILNTINPNLLKLQPEIALQNLQTGGGLGINLGQVPPRGSGTDTRSINAEWATQNAPVFKFTNLSGDIVDVRACDTKNFKKYKAFGKTVETHKELMPLIISISDEWKLMPDKYEIDSIGGYSCRTIKAGGSEISTHAYGITIDINATKNPYLLKWTNRDSYTDMPQDFIDLFVKKNFGWGGNWSSKKDAMHFSKEKSEGGDQKFN